MSPRPAIVLALLVLENAHLVVAAALDHGSGHRRLVEQRRTDLGLALRASHEEDLTQGDLLADGGLETLDVDVVALADPVLLSPRPDDRVHAAQASLARRRRNTGDYHALAPDFNRPTRCSSDDGQWAKGKAARSGF